MVLPPLDPGLTLTVEGDAVRVKPAGAAVTVSETVTLAVIDPEVPVTVTVEVPAGELALTLNFKGILDPDAVPHVAVTPAGTPETETVTVPVNPVWGTSVMVLDPLPP